LLSWLRSCLPSVAPTEFKNSDSDFTRRRKLDFKTIFAFILASASSGKDSSLTSDKNSFFSFCRLLGVENGECSPHKSSISRAKSKISFLAFKSVLDQVVDKYQKLSCDDKALKWNDLRLYAIDGTKIRLPATDELRKQFDPNSGRIPNTGKGYYPMARLSSLYDVCSGLPISMDFKPCDTHENHSVPLLLPRLNELEKGVLILDRGYTGAQLYDLIDREYKGFFLIRAHLRASKNIQVFLESKKLEDEIIFQSKMHSKDVPPKKYRVIRMESKNGELSVLVTNLPSKTANAIEIQSLYKKRWEIEIEYRTLKKAADLEKFQSRSLNGILQELYAYALTRAITTLLTFRYPKKVEVKNAIKCMAFGAILFLDISVCLVQKCYEELLKRLSELMVQKARQRTRSSFPRLSLMPKNKWNMGTRDAMLNATALPGPVQKSLFRQ